MDFVTELTTLFQAHANSAIASGQEKYMKHKFKFLGLSKPVRAELAKPIIQKHKILLESELIKIVAALWSLEHREYHYTALELSLKYKKIWTPAIFDLFFNLLTTYSWWDSVDTLASQHIGTFMQRFPEYSSYTEHWVTSDNFWLRRTALLYQLRYKEKTDAKRLFNYCERLMHEREFFIRKAIGWSLREYSKTDKSSVRQFLRTHTSSLSPLSLREASKYI